MYIRLSVLFFIYICWLLQMSSKRYIGFADGAIHHTCNLASAAWVIYSPLGQLVATGGAWFPSSIELIRYEILSYYVSPCKFVYWKDILRLLLSIIFHETKIH